MAETETVQSDSKVVDGRTARRERGRILVIDAMIDLVFEGHIPPTAERVAERAEVSMSTLFRYFDTFDDLHNQTVRRYFDRYSDRYEIPDIGQGSFEERLDGFVTSRLELYEFGQPFSRLVRQRAPQFAGAAQLLDWLRAELAKQVRQHFHEELTLVTPAVGDDLVAVVATLTSFEAWDQLHNHHHRSPAQIRRAWKQTLAVLLKERR